MINQYGKINFSKIKLIIWDLDDTLWEGTISEENVKFTKKYYDLLNTVTDFGIVNSICSKNDFNVCMEKLIELNIWHLFVFPSISWDAKAGRIKDIINKMNLREENVLFVDDNIHNLEEVRFYLPKIMLSEPNEVIALLEDVENCEIKDVDRSRLEHYKILEKKHEDCRSTLDNVEFLLSSKIKVKINYDCENQIDRIYELIQRTNQLNYTKNRCTLEELSLLIRDNSRKSAYVQVFDKYGDYGIVGFYSLFQGKLDHFLFSCRSLGMGVEQFLFQMLGYPAFETVGDVTVPLVNSIKVDWIEVDHDNKSVETIKNYDEKVFKIIAKGPCDIEQTITYLEKKNKLITEFTYVGENGSSIESHNHTYGILGTKIFSPATKNKMIDDLIFLDKNIFNTKLFTEYFDVFVYGLHTDVNLGIYKRINTLDEHVAFGECYFPLTDEKNWDGYISGKIFNAGVKFHRNFLEKFSKDYEFQGRIESEIFRENLIKIRSFLPKETLMILINGSETPYLGNKSISYNERHLQHQKYNKILKEVACENINTFVVDVNKYINSQNHFTNNINHYSRQIYYNIAREISDIVKKNKDYCVTHSGRVELLRDIVIDKSKNIIKALIR